MRVSPAIAALLLVVLIIVTPARPASADSLDYDIPNGHFYRQTNGFGGAGDAGFAVVDDGQARFWSEFKRLGGVATVGYPVSQRFTWDGFVVQAFQKMVLQWRPEARAAYFVNVFDRLSAAGKDDWLATVRSTPPSANHSADVTLAWANVVERHLALLDANPAVKARYLADADPIQHYGLPMSYKDYDDVFVVRAQRAVFQQWKVEVPWARAGQVVVTNGGDVAREAGMYPAEAVVPADPKTQVIWMRRFGAASNAQVNDVAADKDGNAYVAGESLGALGERNETGQGDAFLRKYTPDGSDLWTRRFGADGSRAVSVGLDGSEHAYVIASSPQAVTDQSPSDRDETIVLKYDRAGNELWTRRFARVTPPDASARPVAGAVDTAGNVYVAGHAFGAPPGQSCCPLRCSFLRKYDSSGNELWTRELGSGYTYEVASIAVDRSGQVYVGGSSGEETFLRKYDPSGSELWTRKFRIRDSLSGFDTASHLAADHHGNVFAAGIASGAVMSELRSGAYAGYVARYDPNGNQTWVRKFQLVSGTTASDLVVDDLGQVYVSGTTGYPHDGPTGLEAFLRHYDGNGDVLSTHLLTTPDNDVAATVGFGVGHAYVGGWSFRTVPELGLAREAFVAKLLMRP